MTTPVVTLTDGTTSLPLVYNAANTYQYKILYGAKVAGEESRPIWHTPDEYPPELIGLIDENRVALFDVTVGTSARGNDDITLNELTVLKRWVSGANQQAAKFWLPGNDVNRISLKIQRKDSTTATFEPVLYGFVDDSEAHYDPVSVQNGVSYKVSVKLYLAPYGEAENAETVKNVISNADFYFEGGTSGLAAKFGISGSPTPTLDTTNYLINGKSQKIVAATTELLQSNAYAAGSQTSAVAYAWLFVTSGDVVVSFYDDTGAANVTTKTLDSTDSNAVSDKSTTDTAGNTWYRVSFSETGLTGSSSYRLRFTASGSATFNVDGAYLRFGVTDIPAIWGSLSAIDNKSDVADQSPQDPDRVCYIDVWGVPGDATAVIDHTITSTVTGDTEQFVIGAFHDRQNKLAAAFAHWVEAEDLTKDTETGGTWALATEAGASGAATNNTYVWTSSNATNEGHLTYTVPYMQVPSAIYVRAKCNTANATMTVVATSSSDESPIIDSTTVTLSTSGYKDFAVGVALMDVPLNSSIDGGKFNVKVVCAGTTQTVTVDRVYFIPTLDANLFYGTVSALGVMNGNTLYIKGSQERSWITREIIPAGHKYPMAQPGNITTRIYYNRFNAGASDLHYLTDTFTVTLDVLPRTRHLLGTL